MFDTFENINRIVSLSIGVLISVLTFPYEKRNTKLINLNKVRSYQL